MKTKKIKLPREFRNKWLTALESGKYKQTTGLLVEEMGTKKSYCCIGVAGRCLNVSIKSMLGNGEVIQLKDNTIKKFPKAFYEKKLNILDEPMYINSAFALTLMRLNDDDEMNFKEIAKYIRKNTVGR